MLLLQPTRRLHVREIARLTQTVAGTMSKELDRLYKAGLLEQHRVGNQVQFCANQHHPVYPELSSLLRKTIGLADVLKSVLASELSHIKVAFIFGSVASASETASSDIDVMVIGSVKFGSITNLLYEAQQTLSREINPKVYSPQEWQTKIQTDSSFVRDIIAKPKIFLIGSQHDLDELG